MRLVGSVLSFFLVGVLSACGGPGGSLGEAEPSSFMPASPSPSPSSSFFFCGEGAQLLVDTCYGVVRVTHYEEAGKSVTYASHWSHGGSEFPLEAGGVVSVGGVGDFEILGVKVVLSSSGHRVEDIPWVDGVYFQTCLDDDPERMVFIEAKEIVK